MRFDEAEIPPQTADRSIRVIVDLPAHDGDQRLSVLSHCIERGDAVLRKEQLAVITMHATSSSPALLETAKAH